MECYIIKFFDGSTLEITQTDFDKLKGKDGLVFISSLDEAINMSAIARIIPKSKADELEDKTKQTTGILHDGTPVIRHFGIWYLDGEFDENGRPLRRIDSDHYPEVRKDCVPTKKEFEKIKHLSREDRLKTITEGTREGGLSTLKENNDLLSAPKRN